MSQLFEGVLPDFTDITADQSAQCGPQADEEVAIEETDQVVVLALGQHDAVIAHPQPGLIEVERGQSRPCQVKRQVHRAVLGADKLGECCGRSPGELGTTEIRKTGL